MKQSRLSQPFVEQQRLIAIPAEWQLDEDTCKIGLEAVKRLRAILNADGINAGDTRESHADSRAVAASLGD